MQLRPFHRWRSFWFGVLTFVFIGWASLDSQSKSTSFSVGDFCVLRFKSLTIFMHGETYGHSPSLERKPIGRRTIGEDGQWWQTVMSSFTVIPDNLVIPGLGVIWFSGLWWRWKN